MRKLTPPLIVLGPAFAAAFVILSGCSTATANKSSLPAVTSAAVDGAIGAGTSPKLRLSGLEPGVTARLHAIRDIEVWRPDAAGRWGPADFRLHSWADYRVGADGAVDLERASPLAGTWRSRGSLGLLWSGLPVGRSGAAPPPAMTDAKFKQGPVRIALEIDGRASAEAAFEVRAVLPDVVVEDVRSGAVTGAFAAPKGAHSLPLVIVLHGSEGSSPQDARDAAALFARQGFAAFALAWYRRPWIDMPGAPNEAVNIPLETLAALRDWARSRPEVDLDRIGVRGVSKGAEFALAGASRYDWIDAVVACVPPDAIWQGFGR
ncbi:MAG: acyl-CoA thioesterase/bile acid-CoA:amino acid N-acyltransferase family protein, partial [Parvularculaceae bacterium]|nr:acyl-CoA thioesterase/bile acid-CoA:amino acid N-acyltransferase family protein [Parvularculaceae bacterium]